MICYKDSWYCTVYKYCIDAPACDRLFTKELTEKAEETGLPIEVNSGLSKCFRRMEDYQKEAKNGEFE